MTPDGTRLVARAVHFAAEKHADQRRKGLRRKPYVNHLIEVADLLAEATAGNDAALIAAGYLHDTIEDTATTSDELKDLFGEDIRTLVLEVTDDKSLPKLERKRLQIEMTPKKSVRARLLKIADATSNVRTLEIDPPVDWNIDRMLDYIVWAEQVIASCRGLNAFLETAFDNAVVAARAAVKHRQSEGAQA
jgi:(p)ppGpp synthase/HD superfamily hydrolase